MLRSDSYTWHILLCGIIYFIQSVMHTQNHDLAYMASRVRPRRNTRSFTLPDMIPRKEHSYAITKIKHIHNRRYLRSSGRKKSLAHWRTDLRHNNLAKLFKYRTAGVWEYWIVNPLKNTVQVYLFEGTEDSSQYSFDDDVTVTLYGDLKICIADLLN